MIFKDDIFCSLLSFLKQRLTLQEIANGYGDVLSEKRRHDEAAIFYVKGENWARALDSYLACHHWQQVFCMTARLEYSPDKEAQIARKLAGRRVNLMSATIAKSLHIKVLCPDPVLGLYILF